MFKKNKFFIILSYFCVFFGIGFNFINIFAPIETTNFILKFSSWISAVFFIIAIVSIYKNKSLKNKIIKETIEEYLKDFGDNCDILKSDKDKDFYLISIDWVEYNLNVLFDNNNIVIMKQLANVETDFYIKNKETKKITKSFNYLWDEIDFSDTKKETE